MSISFEYTLIPTRARPVRRPPPEVITPPRKPKAEHVPHLLALGHRIQDMYEAGEIADFCEAAIRLHRSRTRISQIVSLTQLAPDIQERLLLGQSTIAEIHLRKALVSAEDWETQRALLKDKL